MPPKNLLSRNKSFNILQRDIGFLELIYAFQLKVKCFKLEQSIGRDTKPIIPTFYSIHTSHMTRYESGHRAKLKFGLVLGTGIWASQKWNLGTTNLARKWALEFG